MARSRAEEKYIKANNELQDLLQSQSIWITSSDEDDVMAEYANGFPPNKLLPIIQGIVQAREIVKAEGRITVVNAVLETLPYLRLLASVSKTAIDVRYTLCRVL